MDSPKRAASKDCYHACDLLIDVGRQTVSRSGIEIPLPRLSFELLVALVEAHPQMLSIEELIECIWAPAVVNTETVSQRVFLLRQSLGDDPHHPRYIIGVRGRGYRFDAPVTRESAPTLQDATRVTRTPARVDAPVATATDTPPTPLTLWFHRLRAQHPVTGLSLVLSVALLLSVGGALWLLGRGERGSAGKNPETPAQTRISAGYAAAQSEPSIAVLPFVDMSEMRDQEYFADGMAEDLLDVLVRIPGLKVIGRTSSFQFKGRNEDARSIGAKLGVANIVEGSVRKVGSRIRVTAQLIDARTGDHVWGDSYDRDFSDALALQDQIAATIGRALLLAVDPGTTPVPRRLRNPESYTLFLRGQLAYDRGPTGWREAQSYFEKALALDPSYLPAAERLVRAYGAEVMDSYVPSDIGWQKTNEAIRKTLLIDPHSAVAHIFLGYMNAANKYDWAAAQVELEQAVASHTLDPIALSDIAWLEFDLGPRDGALRLIDAALVTDPLNPDTLTNKGMSLYFMGNLDGAERALRKCLEISPSYTENYLYLGEIELVRGHYKAALAETMRATPYDGRDIGLAMIYHAMGRKAESDAALTRVMRDYGDLWPQDVAQVYAYRGELDEAFKWLDNAYAARRYGLLIVRDDPLFVRARSDPRYKTLLKKMNLAEVVH